MLGNKRKLTQIPNRVNLDWKWAKIRHPKTTLWKITFRKRLYNKCITKGNREFENSNRRTSKIIFHYEFRIRVELY
jgi:hypothetical protein